MGKIQLPSVGGIRKVIKTGQTATPGTTIAELGDQTITLAQLAALLTIIQQQQTNTGGGNIGDGTEATLLLGPGLAGGGPLVGNVPIRLTAPIPALLAEDGQDGEPGPPGANGARGVTGGTGPTGPAVFMAGDDGEDGWHAIPGNQGPQGVQGSQGPQGTAGSGSSSTGPTLWIPDDIVTDEELYRGPVQAEANKTINNLLTINGNQTFDAGATRTITFPGITPLIDATATAAVLQIRAVNSIQLTANSQQIIVASQAGGVTIAKIATTSPTCTITGQTNVGLSRGLLIQSGTNSSDYALQAVSSTGSAAGLAQFFEVFGDGGVTIGQSATVDKGAGTLNVQNGIYAAGVLVIGGANSTPAGVHHGMVAEDPYWEEEVYRGPTGAEGATVFNGQVIINPPANSSITPGLQINAKNASTDALILNGISGTVGPDFNFMLDGTATKGILGVASKANDGVTGITTGEMFIRTQTARLLLTVDAGSTAALIVSTGGPATFSSTLACKGPTPAAVAGTTTLGTTTTTTGVITTAGGVALPALALNFWVVDINGVQVGIPCFAL